MPSLAHRELKKKAIQWLKQKGFSKIIPEYRVTIDGKTFVVDVVGFQGGKSIAVECGRTRFQKILLLQKKFGVVKRFHYTRRLQPFKRIPSEPRDAILYIRCDERTKQRFINFVLERNYETYEDAIKTLLDLDPIDHLLVALGFSTGD